MKVRAWLSIGLLVLPCAAAAQSVTVQFCPVEVAPLHEQHHDAYFVAAMFKSPYVFRGRLFSFYDDRCDGQICTWGSLVFKRLENIKGIVNPYIEGDWVEDCNEVWRHQSAWRHDKLLPQFTINSEYLILATDSPSGIKVTGSRSGLKVNQLMMQYQLAVIGGQN